MALPTVTYDYDAAQTNASIPSVVLTKLHGMLVSKGWSIEYADSAAIGGGSAGDPAWDSAFSSGADIGTVVYQMPANDHATEWFVKFTAKWGSATDRWAFTFAQCGVGHDGSGNLSGGGSGITRTASTGSVVNVAHHVATSEDGLFVLLDASTSANVFLLVERVRSADGAVGDDAFIMMKTNTISNSFTRAFYNASSGEDTSADIIMLSRISDNAAWGSVIGVASLVSADGGGSALVGPYPARRDNLGSPPRLACIIPSSDASLGGNVQLNVDGAPKTYRVANNTQSIGYFAIATE